MYFVCVNNLELIKNFALLIKKKYLIIRVISDPKYINLLEEFKEFYRGGKKTISLKNETVIADTIDEQMLYIFDRFPGTKHLLMFINKFENKHTILINSEYKENFKK